MLPLLQISELKLQSLKEGDSKVFNEIFDTYWQKLYAAAYSRIKDEQQAQDIVQDVFIHIWDRREHLSLKSETLEFYLLKSVKNRVINFYYKEKVRKHALSETLAFAGELENIAGFEERYPEMEIFVNSKIKELPTSMKRIYLMKENNYSIKEIAKHFNLAEQTIKNNITEASHRLRTALKKKFNAEYVLLVLSCYFY